MLTKILIFLAVVIGVFVVARLGAASAFKPASRTAKVKGKKARQAEEMRPCPVCGAYVAGGGCDCGQAPTP